MAANEQQHGFELRDDFFWRKTKWMGAGISGGGPHGTHKVGGAPKGVGSALHPCGPLVQPPGACSVPEILKYFIKIILNFQGIWRTFIFGTFFIARII